MSTWISRGWGRARCAFPGLASVFFLTAASAGSQELQLDRHQQLALDLFRELIEINTVESEGTAPAAEAMARRLLDAGFAREDVHIVGPDDRKVNLVARLRGRDTGRAPILLLAHLDVVEAPPSPLTPNVLGLIERITEEMWPGVPVVPIMSTGATDGLYLRRAGIPTYGVSGIFSDVDDNRDHGQDERVLIESFYEGQEFLCRLVKALSGTIS